ncbi:MAG TPA: phosphoglycerate kinase [Methanomicrobia archaeon]|nr:MAG: phosphoglycerate kinase [Thermococci archaeon]HDN81958.1 phosphoglycerate kinase [Methanomicrobia archaeon]
MFISAKDLNIDYLYTIGDHVRIIETSESIVLADISDISYDLDTVYLRADINEPPRPSLRVEQTVRTILAIRQLQKKKTNILCTSHSSIPNGSLKENFQILKEMLEREIDPINPEVKNIIFVKSLEEMKRANEKYKESLIFLDNVRKTVPEERNPPANSSNTEFWKLVKDTTKINGALSSCHRDNLSLRVFSDGCFCNSYFARELEDITKIYNSENGNIKIWGIAGAKRDKLRAILLTEGKEDLLVNLDGGPIFVLLLWALINKAPSLGRTLPHTIGKLNKELIEKFFGDKWESTKAEALKIAEKINNGLIDIILPIDVLIEDEDGIEKVVDLRDIDKGRFISIGPNTIKMIGNISTKRIFLQNGSVEPRTTLETKSESITYLLIKSLLKRVDELFLNGGDTVSDVRSLENELELAKYRKDKLRELAVGGFVVHWWNYLNKGREIPPGVEFAYIGSLRNLYMVRRRQQDFT